MGKPKSPSPAKGRRANNHVVIVERPIFKKLLWINMAICAFSGIGMLALAWSDGANTEARKQVMTAFDKAFFLTVGAFVGLLGGLAGSQPTQDTED